MPTIVTTSCPGSPPNWWRASRELIYAPPQTAALAARQATATIPIVFCDRNDPVGAGLVASLAHPGGNVTGIVNVVESLVPKRLELLHEMFPNAKRIAFLGDPNDRAWTSSAAKSASAAPGPGSDDHRRAKHRSRRQFDAAVAN